MIAYPLPKPPEPSEHSEEKAKTRQPTLFDDGDGEDARETMSRQ
jgi:hypothetical protein